MDELRMPGMLVRFRPTGPWRIGPDSGARDRVDHILHSDALYSAVCSAMGQLGLLDDWLAVTAKAEGEPAVRFSSCFPWQEDELFVVPPRNIWPPPPSAKVRWKGARFVPLSLVSLLLAEKVIDEERWAVDPASDCLLPAQRRFTTGPFRVSVRSSAAVDRLSPGITDLHATACIEFAERSGMWFVVAFSNDEARHRWAGSVKSALRLLADSGIGGERSRGWGRSASPSITEGSIPALLLPRLREPKPKPAAPEPAPEAVTAEALSEPVTEEQAPESAAEPASVPVNAESVESASEPGPALESASSEASPEAVAVEPAPEAAAEKAPSESAVVEAAIEPVAEPEPEPEPAEPEPLSAPEPASEPEVILEASITVDPEAPVPLFVEPAEQAPLAEPLEVQPELLVEPPPEPALEPVPTVAPPPPPPPITAWWLLSLYSPSAADTVDWKRGNYTLLTRAGRVESAARWGDLKKSLRMVGEGSVIIAASQPRGHAPDVAPDGFPHPVFRSGFALAIPIPWRMSS